MNQYRTALVSLILIGAGMAHALEIGDQAPTFTARATGGETVSLEDLKGQWVALYFYPKAGTPGCTKQGCSLRDGFETLEESGIAIYGVSVDNLEKQKEFKEKYNFPFNLVADDDKSISKAYGVLAPLGLFSKRNTFIINPDGEVADIITDIDVDDHAAQIKKRVAELRGEEE